MRKDDHLMFESFINNLQEAKASPSNFSGLPVKPVGNFANSPIPKGYDAMQNMINKKLEAKKKVKSEDAQTLSIHPGDWGDDYQEVSDAVNTVLHSNLIPPHALEAILQDAESVGYSGEGLGDVAAKLNSILPALARAITLYNEKGAQDS